MKKFQSEAYIVEIPRDHILALGQILHLAKEGGIEQAEPIMKDLAGQVHGLHIDRPNIHFVYPKALSAPDKARSFHSCLYVEIR